MAEESINTESLPQSYDYICLVGKGNPWINREDSLFVDSLIAAAAIKWHMAPDNRKSLILSCNANVAQDTYDNDGNPIGPSYSHYVARRLREFGVDSNCFYLEDHTIETYSEIRKLLGLIKKLSGNRSVSGNIDIIAGHNRLRVAQALKDSLVRDELNDRRSRGRHHITILTPQGVIKQGAQDKSLSCLTEVISREGKDYLSEIVYTLMGIGQLLPFRSKNLILMEMIGTVRHSTPFYTRYGRYIRHQGGIGRQGSRTIQMKKSNQQEASFAVS